MDTERLPFVDLHCHCLPGLDDGPADLAASLTLCEALVADGVCVVCATPHQLGRFEGRNSAQIIRDAVASLQRELDHRRIPLRILPSAEVRIHEQLPDLLAADALMTVADGRRWLLVEMPAELFIEIGELLARLKAQGISVILSHPERYSWIAQRLPQVLKWRSESGVKFQVTAASLLDDFGPQVADFTWHLASLGVVDLVASDAHSAQGLRRPRMKAAWDLVCQRLGEPVARQWFQYGPREVISPSAVCASAPSAFSSLNARPDAATQPSSSNAQNMKTAWLVPPLSP